MRTTFPLVLTLFLHGGLAGACSGEPMTPEPYRPAAPPAPKGARVIDFETRNGRIAAIRVVRDPAKLAPLQGLAAPIGATP